MEQQEAAKLVQEEGRQRTGCEAELIDYLSKNLVESKIHVNDLRQSRNQLIVVVILLVMFAVLCVGGFASVVYLINQENARTIQAVFDSGYEKEVEHVYQDINTGESSNSVINHHSNGNTNTITATANPKKN